MKVFYAIAAALILFVTGASFVEASSSKVSVVSAIADDESVGHIVVQSGEGWDALARRCGTTRNGILLQNPSARLSDVLKVGQAYHCVPDPVVPPTTTIPPTTTTQPPVTTTLPPTTTTQPPVTTTTIPPTTTTTTLPPSGVQFSETFNDTSQSHFESVFGWQVTDITWGGSGGTYRGDHDINCGSPNTSREVHNHSLDQIWLCAPNGPDTGHIMSSAGSADYSYTTFYPRGNAGQVPHTPNSNVSYDNANGAPKVFTGRKVCWDVNLTTANGGRTWWEVIFLSSDYYASNPNFSSSSPDFPGEPKFPVPQITVDFTQNNMKLWTGELRHLGENFWEEGYQGTVFNTDDKAKRYKHCLEDTSAGLVLSQQRDTETKSWTIAGYHLPASYVVAFKAENYNAGKDGSVNQTWHWDNIIVQ